MGVYVSWTKATAEEERGLQEKIEFLKSVFPFQVFSFVRYKMLLRFSIILYFASLYFAFFLLAEKTMFSFQKLLKGTFSLLTCHLQFSITAGVSMTLKRQSVQSLSDQKTARTFCVSQERANSRTNGLEEKKWSRPLVWSRGGESE